MTGRGGLARNLRSLKRWVGVGLSDPRSDICRNPILNQQDSSQEFVEHVFAVKTGRSFRDTRIQPVEVVYRADHEDAFILTQSIHRIEKE